MAGMKRKVTLWAYKNQDYEEIVVGDHEPMLVKEHSKFLWDYPAPYHDESDKRIVPAATFLCIEEFERVFGSVLTNSILKDGDAVEMEVHIKGLYEKNI